MAAVVAQIVDQSHGIRLRVQILPHEESDFAPAAASAGWSAGNERCTVSHGHALFCKILRLGIDQPPRSHSGGMAPASGELQENGPRGIRPRDTTLDKLLGRPARDTENSG